MFSSVVMARVPESIDERWEQDKLRADRAALDLDKIKQECTRTRQIVDELVTIGESVECLAGVRT